MAFVVIPHRVKVEHQFTVCLLNQDANFEPRLKSNLRIIVCSWNHLFGVT